MQDLVINFVSEDIGQEVLSVGKPSDNDYVRADYTSFSLTENPGGITLSRDSGIRFIPWTSIIDFIIGEEY